MSWKDILKEETDWANPSNWTVPYMKVDYDKLPYGSIKNNMIKDGKISWKYFTDNYPSDKLKRFEERTTNSIKRIQNDDNFKPTPKWIKYHEGLLAQYMNEKIEQDRKGSKRYSPKSNRERERAMNIGDFLGKE